jgi:hypothetical protein
VVISKGKTVPIKLNQCPNGQSLEKSSPDYETLCNYGIIADEAA